jgi:hypothetical protein
MEDLDITSPVESSEWGAPSPEAVREKSEKQKESYKKAQTQIQKSKKDEKKAKGDNEELFHILTRFISNPYYEWLIPQITVLLHIALPSRPIIGMLSLIYPDAAHHVFHTIGETDRIHLMQSLYRYESPWIFHERDLHVTLREWMSIWIDSLDRYIVSDGSSLIMQKKFFTMMNQDEAPILDGIVEFLLFFFQSRNIVISRSTTESYGRFILANIKKTLQKSIFTNPDADMVVDESVVDMNLFGL